MSRLTIGIDLAKNIFQVHGIDDAGQVVIVQKLRRAQVLQLSVSSIRALLVWKPVGQRTTGPAN